MTEPISGLMFWYTTAHLNLLPSVVVVVNFVWEISYYWNNEVAGVVVLCLFAVWVSLQSVWVTLWLFVSFLFSPFKLRLCPPDLLGPWVCAHSIIHPWVLHLSLWWSVITDRSGSSNRSTRQKFDCISLNMWIGVWVCSWCSETSADYHLIWVWIMTLCSFLNPHYELLFTEPKVTVGQGDRKKKKKINWYEQGCEKTRRLSWCCNLIHLWWAQEWKETLRRQMETTTWCHGHVEK